MYIHSSHLEGVLSAAEWRRVGSNDCRDHRCVQHSVGSTTVIRTRFVALVRFVAWSDLTGLSLLAIRCPITGAPHVAAPYNHHRSELAVIQVPVTFLSEIFQQIRCICGVGYFTLQGHCDCWFKCGGCRAVMYCDTHDKSDNR